MCFRCIDKDWRGREIYSKLRKARWNITCYKTLLREDDGRLRSWYVSNHYYTPNVVYLRPQDCGEYGIPGKGTVHYPNLGHTNTWKRLQTIDVGYHSFRYKPSDKWTSKREVIVKCVIPKGTYYRRNEREFVSDSIIIKKIIFENDPNQ